MSIAKPPSLPLPSSMNTSNSLLTSPRDSHSGSMNNTMTAPLLKAQNTMASSGSLLASHHTSGHVLPHPQYITPHAHTQTYGSTNGHGSASTAGLQTPQYYAQEPSYPHHYVGMEFGNPSHISQAQTSPPHTVTSNTSLGGNGMGGGLSYHHPPHMSSSYQPGNHNNYSSYPFPNNPGYSSPSHQAPMSSSGLAGPMVPLPRGPLGSGANSLPSTSGAQPLLGNSIHQAGPYSNAPFDTTGQIAPPGVKPRVTATLWEDEGSLCFQVEAKGVCVARREDNHMINGTKLLNVAGMTRGRRDGILKSEKVRHVVKIGPMHLKGVWIPFERALDFANKEKITEILYPLFVHNINALLYHPTNIPRTTAMVNAADRNRQNRDLPHQPQQQQMQQPPQPQHRRTEGIVSSSQSLSSAGALSHTAPMPHLPSHHTLPSHNNGHLGRPGMERSTSFPTPPSSSSSMLGLGNSETQYWNAPNVTSSTPTIGLENGVSSRSMPTTPVTTPPGSNLQMQPYGSSTYGEAYRPTQASLPQQPQSSMSSGMPRYGNNTGAPQSQTYGSQGRTASDMGPPLTSRHQANTPSRPSSRQNNVDTKEEVVEEQHQLSSETDDPEAHAEEEADPEAEHEDEYTHDNGQPYHGARQPYYSSVPSINGDPNHLSSDLVAPSSRNHSVSGGRSPYGTPSLAVPRTVETPTGTAPRPPSNGQTNWSATSGYPLNHSPSAAGTYDGAYPSVSGRDRAGLVDGQADPSYQAQGGVGVSMPTYSHSQSTIGNLSAGTKRGRDDDDDHDSRTSSRGGEDKHAIDSDGAMIKRRKTGGGSPLMGTLAPPHSFDGDSSSRLNRRSALVQRGRR